MNRPDTARVVRATFRLLAGGLLGLVVLASSLSADALSIAPAYVSSLEASHDAPAPNLAVTYDRERAGAITVSGQGFTPKGRVYLAIYDQMAQKLYENRWVIASPRLTDLVIGVGPSPAGEEEISSPGGYLHETFGGLCDASVLVRALDFSTERWSNWQTIQPRCSGDVAPVVANNLLGPRSLPAAVQSPPAAVNGFAGPRAPMLRGAFLTSVDGSVIVAGEGFTAGGRVYIAVHDELGATLYPTRWAVATPAIEITGARADVPESHPLTTVAGGRLHETIAGLCGAHVIIRAYDAETAMWSNWVDASPFCSVASAFGPH
jgi:hypothetical protein